MSSSKAYHQLPNSKLALFHHMKLSALRTPARSRLVAGTAYCSPSRAGSRNSSQPTGGVLLSSNTVYPCLKHSESLARSKLFATLVNTPPPKVIKHKLPQNAHLPFKEELPPLEKYIYNRIQNVSPSVSLSSIYQGYKTNAGRVLDAQLPYESRPNTSRQAGPLSEAEDDGITLIAHVAVTGNGRCKVSLSSGFALASTGAGGGSGVEEQHVVTCCHTLEEVSRTVHLESLVAPAGVYVFPAFGEPIPVTGVLSSLPRHDILLLSIPPAPRLRTLPLSPYPAPSDSAITTRYFSSPGRPELQASQEPGAWVKWLNGHALRKWATGGKVLGYRDLAGRESKAGGLSLGVFEANNVNRGAYRLVLMTLSRICSLTSYPHLVHLERRSLMNMARS
ncbi:hypothetical protein FRC12_005748 [Ceratobasidium sp. 428]|nr:hypothetical protein FRC12_005748 [Ceratobasidium sp. 428]